MIVLEIFKRIFILALIVFLLPVFFLLTIISFLDTKKFPILIQERGLTLNKFRFKLFKFRTIRDFPSERIQNSNLILKKRDLLDYVSPIGRFLRKTGLDELPQLINILLGQMNFFGPRALSIEDLQEIKSKFPDFYIRREKINSKPGLLGLWQVNKDFQCSVENLIRLDEEFDKFKSLKMNYRILLKAIEIILFGYHIDSIVNGDRLKVYPIVIYATIFSSLVLISFFIFNFVF
jgi:O-antigen biosynthesis protein WbqP